MKRFFLPTALTLCAIAIALTFFGKPRQIPLPPGPVARADPQIHLVTNEAPWSYKNYSILPIASCRLRAFVLSSERYYFDRKSKFSPVDIVVGWGDMSDSTYVKRLRVTQGSRTYSFHYEEPGLPEAVILAQSKILHIIPATPEIAQRAKAVSKGQAIRAGGWLVKVTEPADYTWVSSLSTGGSGENSGWVLGREFRNREPPRGSAESSKNRDLQPISKKRLSELA